MNLCLREIDLDLNKLYYLGTVHFTEHWKPIWQSIKLTRNGNVATILNVCVILYTFVSCTTMHDLYNLKYQLGGGERCGTKRKIQIYKIRAVKQEFLL